MKKKKTEKSKRIYKIRIETAKEKEKTFFTEAPSGQLIIKIIFIIKFIF